MSRATKRKHVITELTQNEFQLPSAGQQIVRVVSSKGNNLHEVEATDNATFLVSMPTKFRKNVWVKRGDFLLVEPIEEGDKVKAEMVAPLTREYIRFLKEEKTWPPEFEEPTKNASDDFGLPENTNRPAVIRRDSSSDSDSSES